MGAILRHVTVLLVVASGLEAAQAMCCGQPPSPEEAAEEAVAIFVGEVAAVGTMINPVSCVEGAVRDWLVLDPPALSCRTGYLFFEVEERFKGTLRSNVAIHLDSDWSGGSSRFIGTRWLVYATLDANGRLAFPSCGRIVDPEKAHEELKLLRTWFASTASTR